MPPRLRLALMVCFAIGSFIHLPCAPAQEVWSGLTFSFTRPDGVDGTLPEYQDTITPNVVFARQDTQGLYNAASEIGYGASSPEFTEWATGLIPANDGLTIAATNHAALTFTNWGTAYGNSVGNTIVGESAVVHLIAEDVYLDIKFTSWANARNGGQGGFEYLRAVPPADEPSGDYNGDDTVNAADYTFWRDTLGQSVSNPGDGADGNRSGMIDAPDYDHWKARFGNSVPGAGGAITTVPEPGAMALLAFGISSLLAHRRSTPSAHVDSCAFQHDLLGKTA